MKAVLRRTRISPKKANLVAGTIRGKSVQDALDILKFMPKKGAKLVYKVLHSAASNAKNNFKQPFDELVVTKVLVTKGPTYKRSVPISRGRTHPIRKRTSHITVEVGLPTETVGKEKVKTPLNKKAPDSEGKRAVKDKPKKTVKKSTDK